MRRRLPLVAVLVAVGVAAGCARTPPEDFSTPAVSAPVAAVSVAPPPASKAAGSALSEGAPGQASLAGRCITLTPAEPPPPVSPGPAAGCPEDPEGPGPDGKAVRFPIVRVGFAGAVHVDADVVRSQHDTMRGLMYRKSLDEDRGMLFDLGTREDHKFWMHNTCIPLDLLYIDDDGLLVGIVENAPTLNDDARGVGCPSSFVLEVPAGWSRRHGVKAGQRVTLPGDLKR